MHARHARIQLGLAALLVLIAASPAQALDPVNQDRSGVAVEGTDVVAYFLEGRPRAGDAAFAFSWGGASWRFASAANRDLFAKSPEKYAPRYGGYCAYAVSKGTTAPIDPEAWRIVDGKLYLNFDRRVQAIWERDVPGHIAKADANWPRLLSGE